MKQPSLFDQSEPPGVQRVPCKRHVCKHSPYTGAHAYPQVKGFGKVPNRTAPTTPCDKRDPAQNLPTRASRAAAFAAWQAECQRYDAEGRQDEMPPLPAGYVSQGMARLQRGTREPQKWR